MQFLDVREVSELIAAGETTPVEVTRLMLDRIAALDPGLGSYALVMRDSALDEARRAEAEIAAGRRRGPLHGVPVAVKDQCWTAGVPTAAGTLVLKDNVPSRDATVVRRLREAGAVILGKLSMAEAAFGDHHPDLPPAVNPWDAATWAGSSSSGAGVATAAGLTYAAIGTDTGGSIRFPSAADGVTGLKPTWGRVSAFGIEGCAGGTMDHVGPMARSVRDCAILLQAIAGDDPDDPTSRTAEVPDYAAQLTGDVRGLRIGIDPAFNAYCDGLTAATLEAAAEVFRGLGATVSQVSIPDPTRIIDDWKAACAVDLALAHERTFPSRRAEYSRDIAEHLDLGLRQSGTDLRRILQEQMRFTGRLQRVFGAVDLLLTPVTGVGAPTVERMRAIGYGPDWKTMVMRGTAPFNVSGNPALVVPAGFSERGTPVGIQLVAAHLAEPMLLRAGDAFQRVTDHHRRHPELPSSPAGGAEASS